METRINGVRHASILSAAKCAGDKPDTLISAFLLCLSALCRDELIISDIDPDSDELCAFLLDTLSRAGYRVNKRLFGVSITGTPKRPISFDIWRAPRLTNFLVLFCMKLPEPSTITFKTSKEKAVFENALQLLNGLNADYLTYDNYAIIRAAPLVRGAVNSAGDADIFLSCVLAALLAEDFVICYNHPPMEDDYPFLSSYIKLY